MVDGPPTFIFDECIGWPILETVEPLLRLHNLPFRLKHVVEYYKGAKDDEWVPEIARNGWIVITADRGVRPSRGGKLPFICKRNGVTHILLSGALHASNAAVKASCIVASWTDIYDTAQASPGSRFILRKTPSGGATLVKAEVR